MAKLRVTHLVQKALLNARESGALSFDTMPDFSVDPPKNTSFGDFSANIAMLLAKQAGKKPFEIANILIKHMPEDRLVTEVSVAGGGFINFKLKPDWLHELVREICAAGCSYGHSQIGNGHKINIEFVSANPNGPIHMAHGRGGAIGDSLARMLKAAGYDVTCEFYVNDALNSLQMQNFADSLLVRYKQLLGQEIAMPSDAYEGEYVIDIAREMLQQFGPDYVIGAADEVSARFRTYAEAAMKAQQKQDLADFGIEFDVWFSEKELHDSGEVMRCIEQLKAANFVYENEGALWLRSTQYGDDKDRVIVRANGQPTYIAADTAYHKNKLDRGFDTLIDIWGPDHHGYVARTKAAVDMLGYGSDKLEVLIHQIVRIFKGGEMVRMSKRAGNVVTLRDVLEEAGRDATRFFLLMRSSDTGLDFDIELATKKSNENPVYYVQYAHARICSILRKAAEEGIPLPDVATQDLSGLTSEHEINLIKKIAELPEEILTAASQRAPHRMTQYCREVADTFHRFYQNCKVVHPDTPLELSKARLALVQAAQITLHNALDLLGVSAPESM